MIWRSVLGAALAIAVMIGACGGSGSDGGGSGPTGPYDPKLQGILTVPDAKTGFVLTPGQTATLTAVLTDLTGAPLAGKGVYFVVPDGSAPGAGGTFVGADPWSPNYLLAVTDAHGSASATLTANGNRGVYLAEAFINSHVTASFGVTNVSAPVAPAIPADAARRAVDSLAPSGVAFPAPRLHGPVLVDNGTTVVPAGPTPASAPLAITGPMWLFWIDDQPGVGFAHPARILLLDAVTATPPTIVTAVTWPDVTVPGGAPTALLPSAIVLGPPAVPPPGQTAGQGSTKSVSQALDNASQSCATILYGANATWWGASSDNLSRSFHKLGLAHVYTKPSPGSLDDFGHHLDQIKADPNCKCVYVYLSSHGQVGSIDIPAHSGDTDWSSYADVAKQIKDRFSGSGVRFKIILNGCHTASAAPAFDGIGVDGELYTGADVDHSSQHDHDWGTRPLDPEIPEDAVKIGEGYKIDRVKTVDDFGNTMADCVKQTASAADAFTWARDHGGNQVNQSNPSCFALHAAPGTPVATKLAADPVKAAFNQSIFTTNYSVVIHNPKCEKVTYTWSGPNCGLWTPQNAATSVAPEIIASMNWQHADPANGGTCDHKNVVDHADATIVLTISTPATTISCSYVGAASGPVGAPVLCVTK